MHPQKSSQVSSKPILGRHKGYTPGKLTHDTKNDGPKRKSISTASQMALFWVSIRYISVGYQLHSNFKKSLIQNTFQQNWWYPDTLPETIEKTPENMASQKVPGLSSKHQFTSAFAVSPRECNPNSPTSELAERNMLHPLLHLESYRVHSSPGFYFWAKIGSSGQIKAMQKRTCEVNP